jgi:transposase
LPLPLRHLIERLLGQLKEFDRQVADLEPQIQAWHRGSELSRRLKRILGIGPLTASASVASITDARSFDSGRQLAGAGAAAEFQRRQSAAAGHEQTG